MTLEDGQWQLLESLVEGAPAVLMGPDTDYPIVGVSGRGLAPLRSRQYARAGADGVTFGREYRDARTLTLEGTIRDGQTVDGCYQQTTEAEAWALIDALEAVWDVPTTRTSPRTLTWLLEKRVGDADDTVYAGRPGRFDYDTTNIYRGVVLWVATYDVTPVL